MVLAVVGVSVAGVSSGGSIGLLYLRATVFQVRLAVDAGSFAVVVVVVVRCVSFAS